MTRELDVIDELCLPLAVRLWAMYANDESGPRLILPSKRDASLRVSEQESKILLCEVLEDSPWYYSIEAPTSQTYRQSGSRDLSARTDLAVYSSRAANDRVLNVELKAHSPNVESFRKDLEKLARERVEGLWFHTLLDVNSQTMPTMFAKVKNAFSLIGEHTVAGDHQITFAFCVLKRRLMYVGKLQLGEDLDSRVDDLFDSLDAWKVSRPPGEPEVAPGPRTARTRKDQSMSATIRDRTGHEKWLIYCPQISQDSLLHLSVQGDSYAIRVFTGTALEGKPGGMPFHGHDAAGRAITVTSEFSKTYEYEKRVDVLDQGVSVDKVDRWRDIIARHNARLGIGA